MDFLLEHANLLAGGLMYNEALAILHALDIQKELILKISWNTILESCQQETKSSRLLWLGESIKQTY